MKNLHGLSCDRIDLYPAHLRTAHRLSCDRIDLYPAHLRTAHRLTSDRIDVHSGILVTHLSGCGRHRSAVVRCSCSLRPCSKTDTGSDGLTDTVTTA